MVSKLFTFKKCLATNTDSFLVLKTRAVDPDLLNSDLFVFLGSKIAIYLGPSYRRSLQLSKENIQHFKKLNLFTFSMSVGRFFPPGSGSGLRIWIRIQGPH
jgi:hypothetical protein